MSNPRITQALKASGKSLFGLPGVMMAAGAFSEYSSHRGEGDSVMSSGLKTALTNVLPNLLLTGPRGALYSALIYGLPAIPAIAGAVAATSQNREMFIRHSAQPFSHYGYAPTMGAVQSMQRCIENTTNMRGLSQTHAGLASQALRR